MNTANRRSAVLENRYFWRAFTVVAVSLVTASIVWDNRQAGEVADALLILALVGIGWVVGARQAWKLRVVFAVLGGVALVQFAYAVVGADKPAAIQVALIGVAGGMLAYAILSIRRLHRPTERRA